MTRNRVDLDFNVELTRLETECSDKAALAARSGDVKTQLQWEAKLRKVRNLKNNELAHKGNVVYKGWVEAPYDPIQMISDFYRICGSTTGTARTINPREEVASLTCSDRLKERLTTRLGLMGSGTTTDAATIEIEKFDPAKMEEIVAHWCPTFAPKQAHMRVFRPYFNFVDKMVDRLSKRDFRRSEKFSKGIHGSVAATLALSAVLATAQPVARMAGSATGAMSNSGKAFTTKVAGAYRAGRNAHLGEDEPLETRFASHLREAAAIQLAFDRLQVAKPNWDGLKTTLRKENGVVTTNDELDQLVERAEKIHKEIYPKCHTVWTDSNPLYEQELREEWGPRQMEARQAYMSMMQDPISPDQEVDLIRKMGRLNPEHREKMLRLHEPQSGLSTFAFEVFQGKSSRS